MSASTAGKAPHHVDRHVGQQIRNLRRRLHVSQEKLADTLGLTFQQVQKYEKGTNRVSASKLFEAAAALRVDIGYFFQGLHAPGALPDASEAAEPFEHEAPATAEGREVDDLLVNMSRKHRRLVLDVARALAAGSAPEPMSEAAQDDVGRGAGLSDELRG